MFPETLETERLRSERLSRETANVVELYRFLVPNPDAGEMLEFVDFNSHRTVEETFDMVKKAEDDFENATGANYVIRPKPTEDHRGEVAGITGLYPKWGRRFDTHRVVLDKRFWGRGYSAERAALFIEVAFERLNLERVAVKYNDGNETSKRAIEKYVDRYNGQYEGLLRNWLPVGEELYDCHRYSSSRDQYTRSKQ